MGGTVRFDADGRHSRPSMKRELGTKFTAEVRMTRDEVAVALDAARQVISPSGVTTTLNGDAVVRPAALKTFTAQLPTEVADADGNLRRSRRECAVEVFDGPGQILEMGIPVCAAEFPWRLNVMQKIPLNMERDSVTDAFRRALTVAAVNAMAETIQAEDAAKPWVQESIGDSRCQAPAVQHVIRQQFGDRAVVAVPGDPIANARAEAAGYTVVHGGALSADVWANVRKAAIMPTTASVFPTPPAVEAAAHADAMKDICPLCGQTAKAK